MRHDASDPHPGTLTDMGQNSEGVAFLASPTSHTRVKFQMHGEHDAQTGRLLFQILDLIDRMGGEMEFLVRQQVHGSPASIELVDRHEDENVGPSSRGGHRNGLLRVVGCKRPDSHLGHRSSDPGGSKSVRVGFDDRTDSVPIRHPTSGHLRDRLEISLKSIQIDPN